MRLPIKHETCFRREVYLLVSGLFIHQMSHKLNFYLSSINMAIDLFFRIGFFAPEFKDVSKKKLKSPAKNICLSNKSLIVSKILSSLTRVAACSASVLGLYLLTRIKLISSTLTSNIKIRPLYHFFV